ncbi:uncharacterized protein TRIADDRAFT_51263 [Trichoplax adhaerens]|uniref:Peptidase M3A/M3B catalytic domain-containing protein n=1 Tax=Trichoplax adhaerens TaxID=10228 RepID=B3RI46_TRIAD|nr:hypothetical protein TRIADDRAFT_51263 [Trichoplax adhaerens]EDV29207.1 hypothetical protein TRIADDRAFT_51263 [Trichoplax adhaerens]|eukprot:XP_002108409.1 hypothetical protein TRIADDRAFT_51263 [Trichoplax adhaerens]
MAKALVARMFVQMILTEPPSGRSVDLLDQLSNEICLLADLANFIRLSHSQPAFVSAAESTCMTMLSLVSKLNTNVGLYNVLKEVVDNKTIVNTMKEDTKIVARLLLNDFEQSGVHLDDATREKKVKLDMEIVSLCDQFIQQCHAPTLVSADRCPKHLINSFRSISNYVEVTYTYHDSPQEDLREFAYRAYNSFNYRQDDTLKSLLKVRQNMSQLAGFKSFAHQILLDTMVQTPENALNFLKSAANAVKHRVEKELEDMLRMKQLEYPLAKDIKPWDVNHFALANKKIRLPAGGGSVSEYFSVGTCMEGLNTLFKKIYNVSLVPVRCGRNEGVYDGDGDVLGYLYCDLYARYKKFSSSDSHHTISGGKLLEDGSYQQCLREQNINMLPVQQFSSLLAFIRSLPGFEAVILQIFMLTGTRCAIDFAEVPSVLMERFASDHRVLAAIGRHHETGMMLPDNVIKDYIAEQKCFTALDLQHHLNLAIIDLTLHCHYPSDGNINNIVNEILEEYSAIPYVKGAAPHLRFGHFGHYGARYYSYIWSRAIASMIWTECFKENPFSSVSGENYRRKALAYGGGKMPKLMVEDILGREISSDALVQALVEDIES